MIVLSPWWSFHCSFRFLRIEFAKVKLVPHCRLPLLSCTLNKNKHSRKYILYGASMRFNYKHVIYNYVLILAASIPSTIHTSNSRIGLLVNYVLYWMYQKTTNHLHMWPKMWPETNSVLFNLTTTCSVNLYFELISSETTRCSSLSFPGFILDQLHVAHLSNRVIRSTSAAYYDHTSSTSSQNSFYYAVCIPRIKPNSNLFITILFSHLLTETGDWNNRIDN